MLGFLNRVLGTEKAAETKAAPPTSLSLADPSQFYLDLFGSIPTASNVVVTPETAMRCAPVRCAVQAISETIGQLPVGIYNWTPAGVREKAAKHPLTALLNVAANDFTPANEFREQITRDALLQGNGYAWIGRSSAGNVGELVRLVPGSVSCNLDPQSGEPVYEGTGGPIPAADLIHLRAPSVRFGAIGDSPITEAKEAIGLAITLEAHAARLFGNGARPSGLIAFKNPLGPEAVIKAKAAWQAAHGGNKSGGTAVLDNDAAWQSLALSSVDAQFLEMRKHAIEEIARVFRVPPVLLMEYGRATWGNSEEMGRQFVTYALMPWIRRWEGELRLKLFSASDRTTSGPAFDVDELLRADLAQRSEAYSKLIAMRAVTPNEVRAWENLPPMAGGDQLINPNIQTADVGR